MSVVQTLYKDGLIHPPTFVKDGIQYETQMGSIAYGCSSDTSDEDIYGWTIPLKTTLFPHLEGEIYGFGKQKQRFEQYQEHHIKSKDGKKEYDLSIYNIVKYFQLCMENNPNMIDSLFVPQFCIRHITAVGQMVRENRKLFLHRGSWHKFKGYSFAQLHKASNKKHQPGSKRAAIIEAQGMETKFLYHVVRLLNEAEQILEHGDLDLLRDREQLKAIRRGEVPEADIRKWASDKELHLEKLYATSKLQMYPPEGKIKQLLLDCLEHHFGSLTQVIQQEDASLRALKQIRDVIEANREIINR